MWGETELGGEIHGKTRTPYLCYIYSSCRDVCEKDRACIVAEEGA